MVINPFRHGAIVTYLKAHGFNHGYKIRMKFRQPIHRFTRETVETVIKEIISYTLRINPWAV